MRSLHVHMEEAETKSVAGAKALVEDARAMRSDSEGKCAKWERQCKRMEREMTELVPTPNLLLLLLYSRYRSWKVLDP